MSLELILRLAGGVLLVGSNTFFVAAEFALTRLRQFSEDEVADRPGLREGWEMTERLETHLTGCQLGIPSSSILPGIVAEPAVTGLTELGVGWVPVGGTARHITAVVVAVVFINLVHKIWGEQAPRPRTAPVPERCGARCGRCSAAAWCRRRDARNS